jgi:hypothetical protein
MPRKQFTFYQSFYETIEKLPTKSAKLQAYRAVCQYALYGEPLAQEELKPMVQAVFSVMRPVLDTAWKRSQAALSAHNLLQQDKE